MRNADVEHRRQESRYRSTRSCDVASIFRSMSAHTETGRLHAGGDEISPG
jgi:hypothetical protein